MELKKKVSPSERNNSGLENIFCPRLFFFSAGSSLGPLFEINNVPRTSNRDKRRCSNYFFVSNLS